jgi:hypothetical protein
MTKHTAGLLGSLTDEALRAMTDAQLAAKAAALEADGDEISTADEADLMLVYREQERRDERAAQPATWFLATARPARTNGGAQAFLIQARAGAEVEDALRTYGIDGPAWTVQWEPVADLRYGVVDLARLTVIPAVAR